MRTLCWLLVLLFLPVSLTASQVHEFALHNGMKVIVKEDNRAPIVVSQVWYRIGSSYEPQGKTGISHVLEHMMFKGTKNYGPNEFSRIIAGLGGRENAFTGRDYTAYFQTLSSEHLQTALELEADRMRNLLLDPAEVMKELDVVMEERRLRTDDQPTAVNNEQFNAVAWRVSPYRQPIIGWMQDIQNLTLDDLQAWYQRWYAPNNATLVVVGDVQADAVLALAQDTFGLLSPSELLPPMQLDEPPHQGVTRIQVRVPAKQPYLIMGYKAPVLATATADEAWEPYALEVMTAILSGGSSSRLTRNLVRGGEIAATAGAGYDAYSRLHGMVLFSGIPAEGRSIKDLEKALMSEIEKIRVEPVSEQELQRVITQTVASKVFELDSVFYQAMQIGLLDAAGLDWRLLDDYVDNLKAVTAEQVLAVAQRYLQPDNLSIAVLDPLPMDDSVMPTAAPMTGGRHHGM